MHATVTISAIHVKEGFLTMPWGDDIDLLKKVAETNQFYEELAAPLAKYPGEESTRLLTPRRGSARVARWTEVPVPVYRRPLWRSDLVR